MRLLKLECIDQKFNAKILMQYSTNICKNEKKKKSIYPESVKKFKAVVTTDIQKTGHAEIIEGFIIRIRSV